MLLSLLCFPHVYFRRCWRLFAFVLVFLVLKLHSTYSSATIRSYWWFLSFLLFDFLFNVAVTAVTLQLLWPYNILTHSSMQGFAICSPNSPSTTIADDASSYWRQVVGSSDSIIGDLYESKAQISQHGHRILPSVGRTERRPKYPINVLLFGICGRHQTQRTPALRRLLETSLHQSYYSSLRHWLNTPCASLLLRCPYQRGPL